MAEEGLKRAMERLESALARLETATEARPPAEEPNENRGDAHAIAAALGELKERHERLKARVEGAIGTLDALIEDAA